MRYTACANSMRYIFTFIMFTIKMVNVENLFYKQEHKTLTIMAFEDNVKLK